MGRCLSCGARDSATVCLACSSTLRRPPVRRLDCGLVVRSRFVHEAAAAALVRTLKYRGVHIIARALAGELVRLLPSDAQAVVPIPRSVPRRVRYGIDPAWEVARALGQAAGIPVVRALSSPLVAPRHAGRGRDRRRPVRFHLRADPGPGAVLVDDVLTTGTTLFSACRVLPTIVVDAVTITAVPEVTSLPSGRR